MADDVVIEQPEGCEPQSPIRDLGAADIVLKQAFAPDDDQIAGSRCLHQLLEATRASGNNLYALRQSGSAGMAGDDRELRTRIRRPETLTESGESCGVAEVEVGIAAQD